MLAVTLVCLSWYACVFITYQRSYKHGYQRTKSPLKNALHWPHTNPPPPPLLVVILPQRPAGFDIVQYSVMLYSQCGMQSALKAAVIDTVSMTSSKLHTNRSTEALRCFKIC